MKLSLISTTRDSYTVYLDNTAIGTVRRIHETSDSETQFKAEGIGWDYNKFGFNTAFGNIYASNREVLLGNQYGVYPACSTYGIVGYIDEFRITSDARYPLSARFTVPNREN